MRFVRSTALAALAWMLVASSASALEWERITINGYTALEIEHMWDDEGEGDPNTSFDADLFDLVVNFQVTDRVRAAADLTWEHGSATEDGRGNVAAEYAFIEYSFSDALKIRAGKMFTPFGIFNEIHTAKPAFLTVKEAASTNKTERIVDGSYRFFPRWGTGIAAQGNLMLADKPFDYDVQLANGEQEESNPFEEDNNSHKSIAARVRLGITDDIQIGTSFYADKPEAGDLDKYRSHGLQLEYEHGAFGLWAEVAYGRFDQLDGSNFTEVGAFIQPFYRFENGVSAYLRYEWLDPNRKVDSNRGTDLLVGLNWEPERWLMIKIENHWFKGQENTNLYEFPGHGYSELKASLVLGW